MGRVQKEKPTHSYSGDKWKTNKTNKKYLRVDFHSRCAYCDDLDFYYGGETTFHVDHFAPKEKFPDLIHRYENLLYACPYCNEAKSDKWPSSNSEVNIVGNIGFANPCQAEYDKHLARNSDGTISPTSKVGEYMVINLKLYLKRHQIFYKIDQIEQKRAAIIQKIEEGRSSGQDVSTLEEALILLDSKFFTYYALWKQLGPAD